MNKELQLIYREIIQPWIIAGPGGFTITPLFHQAAHAASEYTVYDVNKLYLCSGLTPSSSVGAALANFTLYNELNAICHQYGTMAAFWDAGAAAARFVPESREMKNFYFSRAVANGLTYSTFIGYRINRV